MTIIIFDTGLGLARLYPLSLIRPVCDIRHGIFTLREWYANQTGLGVYTVSAPHLQEDLTINTAGPFLCIDSTVLPSKELLDRILTLDEGCSLEDKNGIIAYVSESVPVFDRLPLFFKETHQFPGVSRLFHPIDWVKTNAAKLNSDFGLLVPTGLAPAENLGNRVIGNHGVWMEPGAKALGAFFNTEDGPVYLGKNAQVMEGVCVRGPVAILEGAVVKMGSQIYQGTTIGKYCVAGGEIKNCILGDYSNKAHFGYLGDSITGRWCNLGAGTSNSNVKNNGSEVKVWSEALKRMIPVGKKAGLVMGDYSKTAIHTAIYSGTVVGICCSLHLPGIPEKHIPSFSWGPGAFYEPEKLWSDLENWFQFKNYSPEKGWQTVLEQVLKNSRSS